MALGSESRHGMWSSRWLFVLAAAGSAVGLGNIWKFPYIVGEHGGGAFVLLYLACILLIGVPIMMSETLLGRAGRASPINTMRKLTSTHGGGKFWVAIGWMGVLAGLLILSYYAVIAGWALFYIWRMASGSFDGATPEFAQASFASFQAEPLQMIAWQTVFMILTIYIVGRGVIKGLEAAIRWFMPLLFILLIVLLGYSSQSSGFGEAVDFMFRFNWQSLTPDAVLVAMGQAFFTLSLGMGTIMAYGAYLPDKTSIAGTVFTIAALDTLVAIAAGLVIFPIVFANGLAADSGPGLMFVTMPLAFGMLPGGVIFGAVFFILVSFAAITSAISLTEPALAYLVEEYNAKRRRVSITLGVFCWLLGLGTVLSFNVWSDVSLLGQPTFFDLVAYFTDNVLLPLGGLLISLFAAYVLPKTILAEQLGISSGFGRAVWVLLTGIIAPVSVLLVFVSALWPGFFDQVLGLIGQLGA